MHVREKPPLRQHISAVTPSGKTFRWGEDEPLPENVFGDLRHSSTMPGGYESCEVTLPRKPGVDYSDLERLTTLRVIGAGGQVDGEYRLERAPRVSGDQMAISPQAVGWQAHLDDDKSAREIYVTREYTGWGEPSRQRRLNNIASGFDTASGSFAVSNDQTVPGLVFQIDRLSAPPTELLEAWWSANGVEIGSVFASFDAMDGLGASVDWLNALNSASDDIATASTQFFDGNGADVGGAYFAPGAGRTYLFAQFGYTATFTGDGPWVGSFNEFAVYGTHGLTVREINGTDPGGLYASDIVAHAVARFAPLLQIKPGSIQESSFVIPHLAFLEPTTCSEIVRQASRFNLPDWAVWDDKEFVWYERGTRGKKWRARIGPSQLEETGPQLDRLWNGILVQYQDVDGTTRTVGPTGSGADTESTDLVDSDPENPANKLDMRRWDMLSMGVSTAAGATEIGRRFLEQTKVLDSSGRATIVGWVEDDRGVSYPYSRVRAGDSISFVDASSPGYRRIVRADHTRSSRSCSIDLDAPPDGLQALLERLGVVLQPLGL